MRNTINSHVCETTFHSSSWRSGVAGGPTLYVKLRFSRRCAPCSHRAPWHMPPRREACAQHHHDTPIAAHVRAQPPARSASCAERRPAETQAISAACRRPSHAELDREPGDVVRDDNGFLPEQIISFTSKPFLPEQ